jgi:hypothetical protein
MTADEYYEDRSDEYREVHCDAADDESDSWEPFDLGPYLRGEIKQPQPCVGVHRSDGLQLIYPGRGHELLGETESGKTWLALAAVARELFHGNHVVYIHFEEGDPGSTVERLLLIGADPAKITALLHFVAPQRPLRDGELAALLDPAPAVVVLDGINEGMALHGLAVTGADAVAGTHGFRSRLIKPCLAVGAATLSCDHIPMGSDPSRTNAYGTVHKGNTLDGARIMLENVEPFGRNMRGASHVFVTKDRPGHLRKHGRTTKIPGKTFMGTLVADASDPFKPFELTLWAPKDSDNTVNDPGAKTGVTDAELADIVHQVISAQPDSSVESRRKLFAAMRLAGQAFRDDSVRMAADYLVLAGRLTEVHGKRGTTGYKAAPTASREET